MLVPLGEMGYGVHSFMLAGLAQDADCPLFHAVWDFAVKHGPSDDLQAEDAFCGSE